MLKLKMRTSNKADENYKKLAEMFPNAVTEAIDETTGKVVRAIDKDVLMQEISCKVIDGNEERYQFTWPDKKKSVLLANAPINKTLRPCREESVDFDGTENLYIEGDNLEVLKLLQETYLGKIKMIYIDPPYNTGKDTFVYDDNFISSGTEFSEASGQRDEDGNLLFDMHVNNETNGRFHTDWLNMIYPRLRLAKDLLTEDGVIFISIDDNEVENLKKICNEIFGIVNFEGHIHWRRRHNQPNDKTKMIGLVTEHILVYAKNSVYLKSVGVGKLDITASFTNPDNDPNGPWASKPWKVGSDQSGSHYTITTPSGKALEGDWMGEESTYKRFLTEGRIYFPKNGDGMPRKKYYQFEREEEGQCATNWWPHEQFGHNQGANDCMTELFGVKNIFTNPKPVELLRAILKVGNVQYGDIVLDFFPGSSTTAHAVLQINAEDGGKRKFIMVQIPEETSEKSEAYKAGYKNICEIGKERIRRAAKKIAEENPKAKFDGGFRVLKLDSSNMKDVYYNPEDFYSYFLDNLVDNIKEDRTPEDLLFQVMLDLGILLSSKIEESVIGGKKVFNVENNYLIACFDENVTEDVITEIAKHKPYYFVMRDSSMANDSVATNFEQIFASYSPDTIRKVL
ncbi:site-specific DNA-methyltransferase [Porcipelethomonas ammoniilytica]|uniref:site-specific DNA-methyltransferase n=1 Tax=Porcipelethomonas ammoniilytica TaxID=2981722 RepID=UPI00082270FD|nr:site-specific DNA-methyltransferase [Porcipelethomonas ammoniilytica]MCU6720140.1 site-specific DNA-methyltransferase [Porcipelethomonas ammoniilytica]SCJ03090.1 putative methyltransferase [uncultured Ruminococcus sp.]